MFMTIKEIQELIYELRLNYGTDHFDIDIDTANAIMNYFGVIQDGDAFIYASVIIPFVVIFTGSTLVIFHPIWQYESGMYEKDKMHVDSIDIDGVSEFIGETLTNEDNAGDIISKFIRRRYNAIYYTDTMLATMSKISDLNTHAFWLCD